MTRASSDNLTPAVLSYFSKRSGSFSSLCVYVSALGNAADESNRDPDPRPLTQHEDPCSTPPGDRGHVLSPNAIVIDQKTGSRKYPASIIALCCQTDTAAASDCNVDCSVANHQVNTSYWNHVDRQEVDVTPV
jgi:hypothetical protein